MKLKGQLQWTDYLDSQLLHMQPSRSVRIMLYGVASAIGCGFVGSFLLFATGQTEFPFGFVLPIFFLIVFFTLYRYVILPNQIKKIFNQQKELSLPFEMEFTDTALVTANDLGNSVRPWKNFVKWKENKDFLLLYHSDIMYTLIPKRIFTDPQGIDTVRTYLVNNQISVAKSRSIWVGCVIYVILIIVIGAMLAVGFRNQIP